MKVLVTGSRHWTDRSAIRRELVQLPKGSTVIHGACRGADRTAGEEAHRLGFIVRPYPANWNEHGLAAGPKRNQQMLDEELNIDLCLAFHEDIEASKGTKDMIYRAEKAGIVVKIVEK